MLNDKDFIFIRQWYIPLEEYYPYVKISKLPGHNKGVSGSIIGGSNIGISSLSSPEKIKASSKVLEYITSKEVQKMYYWKDYYFLRFRKYMTMKMFVNKWIVNFLKVINLLQDLIIKLMNMICILKKLEKRF